MRQISPVLRFLLVALMAAASFSAQTNTANIFGTVHDESGAAVPNATVLLVQTDTNLTRSLTTTDTGEYRSDFVPVGPYRVTVTAPGFKQLTRSGIALTVGQNADLDLTLQIGAASDSVNVTADVPLVNLGNATLGRTVENIEVQNLPLVNRDAYQLLSLTPGVQGSTTQNNFGYPELHVQINGSSDNFMGQVAYYLDGGNNMNGTRNSGNAIPNPDALQEFNVQTNNFGAQLGRYSGAVVSIITKTGTNQFHGSAFEFYRSKAFTATTHNTNIKTPYTRHQYGATLGGPIRRDKDFFFVSWGALRFNQGATYTGQVPSLAQRSGNFQENLATDITSCSQTPTAADSAANKFLVCNPTTHTPYAQNIITSALDPTAVAILANTSLVPLPNPTQATDTIYTHRETGSLPQNNDEYLGKLEHAFAKHRLMGEYFRRSDNQRIVPSTLTQRWSYSEFKATQQNFGISDVWTISSNMVNQAYVSYLRQYATRVNLPASSLSDFGSDFGVLGTPSRPQISVANWFTLGQQIQGSPAGTNTYGVRDTLSITKGKHTIYVGGEEGLEKDYQYNTLNNYGAFSFNTATNTRSNQSISDFLLGIPTTMNQDTPEYAVDNFWTTGVFLQDDWRILPNLTINVGVRYDIQTAPTESQNRQANFSAGAQSTVFNNVTISNVASTTPVGLLYPGDPGVVRSGARTPNNHVSPRLGFAWDPFGNGKTVFHGAAGLFFGAVSGNLWQVPSNYQPFAVRAQFLNVTSLTHPYSTDLTDFPTGTNPFPNFQYTPGSGSASFIRPITSVTLDPNFKWPYTYQINFGFTQQIGNSFSFGASYVGSLNRKLPLFTNLNYPQYNITSAGTSGASCTDLTNACGYANTNATVNARRPYNSLYGNSAASPLFSDIFILRANQNTNYSALQADFEQRLSHHVSVKGYYIWSKSLASNMLDGSTLNGNYVDRNLPQLEDRQRTNIDARHRFVASAVWSPVYNGTNRLVRSVFNGWTISAIATLTSGMPFTVTTGTDNNADGTTNDRPSLVSGQVNGVLNNGGSRTTAMKKWFNTSAYCSPSANSTTCAGVGPLGVDGLVKPADLSGPGYRDIDASLFRDFTIFKDLKFQLRGEATNVFNLTNLGQPISAMNNAQFGQITGSNGSNRIIQVGGRILF